MSISTGNSTSLSDLCAICHVNPLKYTCPRCAIHTCSLACVKRHKQWSQCSGVRDPAEYRKRSELATPSSIDKDFNFITRVERNLRRADETVDDRKIDLVPARIRDKDGRITGKVEQEAESRGIKIIRAPKGLSRSKINRTHWAGNKSCVMWTMEWIDNDGHNRISNTHETVTIAEAFLSTQNKKAQLKRKRGNQSEGVVLKPAAHEHECKTLAETPVEAHEGAETALRTERDDQDVVEEYPELTDDRPKQTIQNLSVETSSTVSPELNLQSQLTQGNIHSPYQTKLPPDLYFYLHRPATQARYKCLIPIRQPQQQTFHQLLCNKTLLEFPTLYTLSTPPEQLVTPFITEEEYNKREGSDIPVNITTAHGDHGPEADSNELEDGELSLPSELRGPGTYDESKVLEVLVKDLNDGVAV